MGRRQTIVAPAAESVAWEIMHAPWFKRLDELQERWVPDDGRNTGARISLIQEIWSYVYMGCMQHAGPYTDDERDLAVDYVMADVKRYDPSLKSLGEYVSYHIGTRLNDARRNFFDKEYDAAEKTPEEDDWQDQLRQLQSRWDPEADHAAWIKDVCGVIYARYWKRFSKYSKDQRGKRLEMLESLMAGYHPQKLSLEAYIRDALAVCMDLKDNETRKTSVPPSTTGILVSLEADDGEHRPSGIETWAAPHADPGQLTDETAAAQLVVIALVLNFVALKDLAGEKTKSRKTEYYRMFYTEQLTGAAQMVRLPDSHGRDILEALHDGYFRYFMDNVPGDRKTTLRIIENAVPKMAGALIPGKPMDQPLTWNDELLLPAKVQISYWNTVGVRTSASAISTSLKEYRESLHAGKDQLRQQASAQSTSPRSGTTLL